MQKTDHRIDSGIAGLRLLLRNRRRANASGPPVLFVHGATYASTLTFDYDANGPSWMQRMAAAGRDVWCVDLPGYGGSDRPDAMRHPASAHPPLVDTDVAQTCVRRAVDAVLALSGAKRVALIGYSWGTAICGAVASEMPAQIERLVLYGALWLLDEPPAISNGAQPGAWREVSADDMVVRWCRGLDEAGIEAVGGLDVMKRWANDVIATTNDTVLRAPAGVVKDVIEHWGAGRPTYAPERIRAPTLVVVGAWDRETTPAQGYAVYGRLTSAAERRYVTIDAATHSALLETGRDTLFQVVGGFLGE
ncbi:MAG: alpha/beta fold hydrolase [Pseudomonadota bacterium]